MYAEACLALLMHGLITRGLALAYLGYKRDGFEGLRHLARELLSANPRVDGLVSKYTPRIHRFITFIEQPAADPLHRVSSTRVLGRHNSHLSGRTGLQLGAVRESRVPSARPPLPSALEIDELFLCCAQAEPEPHMPGSEQAPE